jgi:hypothetical protein
LQADLRRAVHTRFTALAYSSSIGGTHVSELGGKAVNLPGPRATLFFAPAQIKKRAAEWGGDGLGQRLVAAWKTFSARVSDPASPWMLVEHHRGPEAVQAAYAQVLGGRGDPRVGHVLSMENWAVKPEPPNWPAVGGSRDYINFKAWRFHGVLLLVVSQRKGFVHLLDDAQCDVSSLFNVVESCRWRAYLSAGRRPGLRLLHVLSENCADWLFMSDPSRKTWAK